MNTLTPWRARVLWALLATSAHGVTIQHSPIGTSPPLPLGTPQPPPAYMKDNINNFWGTAPDKGSLAGPVLGPLNSTMLDDIHGGRKEARQDNSDDYWLSSLGSLGSMPLADSGYQFFRNVKDFGAVGDGVTDDTAAINRAAAAFSSSDLSTLRCGEDCGSTTVQGAVVYFPSGTYLISTPIVQYYYTQFVGNPNSKPVIQGSENFTGIALFDSDFYIPGGDGDEWYINQSNFYRQIRNFVFDMTAQNWTNYDNDQEYVPAGIHWQVGQATSITNCDFEMSVSSADQAATAVGIYMENGSGGFVSDLTFTGGNIGFLAGSQQFTANNLQFTSCLTAIYMQWDWGMTWKNIYVLSCYIAFDCTSYSGVTSQGTGSIAVVDSHFNGVPYAITIASYQDEQPNLVLDNLLVENSDAVVLVSGGDTVLAGSTGALYFNSWALGYQYSPDGSGGQRSGFVDPAPDKPASLLDASGVFFTQSKPQYETVAASSVVVATENGILNDGTGDQSSAINSLLSSNVGSLIFFPAGIYLAESTIKVPVGSTIVGSGWSQIMGTGAFFQDETDPQVLVQVGETGDSGVIEISDMLFTVKGPTAGAILMEWNVHESSQGSAAMWDSHFRVGGASGTDLQLADCPAGATSVNTDCKAASLLLHVTSQASGYFENIWAWVADHDLDNALNAAASESDEGIPLNVDTDISIYGGRGILIESQGPTWLYGSAAEHSQMYQYQLLNASNIFLGHMQTETPYYQPNPTATEPFTAGQFPSDPTFENCADDYCEAAWALRILNSSNVYIYSAGFYSFFQNNELGCTDEEDCQLALIETNYSYELWMYNIFTKGNVQIVSPDGGQIPVLLFNSTTKDGYTSEIAAWLALSTTGEQIGSDSAGNNGSGSGLVSIDPIIWSETTTATIQCYPPCTYVLPPLTLPTATTFSFPPWIGPLEVGWPETTTFTYLGNVTTTTVYVSITTTTTITIPPWTGSTISVSNVVITGNDTSSDFYPVPSIAQTPFIITDPTVINGTTHPVNTRTFTPPPWPAGGSVPDETTPSSTPTPNSSSSSNKVTSTTGTDTSSNNEQTTTSHDSHFSKVHHTRGPPKPTCTHAGGCGTACHLFCTSCWLFCPGSDGGTINTGDSNDPNSSPGQGTSTTTSCETATYSSCSTNCITDAAAATSSCSSTCKDVVGCDTTGTEIAASYTLAPYWLPTFDNWDDVAETAGASNAGSIISSLATVTATATTGANSESTSSCTATAPGQCGNPACAYVIADDLGSAALCQDANYCNCDGIAVPLLTQTVSGTATTGCAYSTQPTSQSCPPATTTASSKTSTTSTTTTTTAWPTNTAINVGEGYCFSSSNGDYVQFTADDARTAVAGFCSSGYVLEPSNTYGQVLETQEDGYAVVVSGSWAPNQAGCVTDQAFSFDSTSNTGDLSALTCTDAWSTDFYCGCEDTDCPEQTSSYGGGYVLQTTESGVCVLLELYAYATTSSNGVLQGGPLSGNSSLVPLAPSSSSKYNVTSGPVTMQLTPEQQAYATSSTNNGSGAGMSLNGTGATSRKALFNETIISALLNGSAVVIPDS